MKFRKMRYYLYTDVIMVFDKLIDVYEFIIENKIDHGTYTIIKGKILLGN